MGDERNAQGKARRESESLIVLDTHVLIWWLTTPVKLTAAARKAIKQAVAEHVVVVSAISILEITTAVRRQRLLFDVPVDQWLADLRLLPELRLESVTADIAQLAGSWGDEMHGDPADRLIAATAISLGAPLITADAKLRASPALHTIW
ncbi:MAG: twitching motility protein PilT [Rhodocyclales bacterium]|nr:twitching motility protein PilT [Rhodocyclales bacterium]